MRNIFKSIYIVLDRTIETIKWSSDEWIFTNMKKINTGYQQKELWASHHVPDMSYLCKLMLHTLFFLYKNIVYKNIWAQICSKLRII